MAKRSSPVVEEIHAICACNSGLTWGRDTTSATSQSLVLTKTSRHGQRPRDIDDVIARAVGSSCSRRRPARTGCRFCKQASSTSRMFSVEAGSHCSLFSEVGAPRANRHPVSARSLLPGSKGLTRRHSQFRCPVPLNYVYVRAEKHLAQSVRVRPNVRSSRLIETATLSMSRTSWE